MPVSRKFSLQSRPALRGQAVAERYFYIYTRWLPWEDLDGTEGKESVTIIQRSGLVVFYSAKYAKRNLNLGKCEMLPQLQWFISGCFGSRAYLILHTRVHTHAQVLEIIQGPGAGIGVNIFVFPKLQIFRS